MLPKAEDFSKALYTFDIGQNDLTSGYFHNMSTDQVKAYVPDVLAQFKNVVKVIHFGLHDYDYSPFMFQSRYEKIVNFSPYTCIKVK